MDAGDWIHLIFWILLGIGAFYFVVHILDQFEHWIRNKASGISKLKRRGNKSKDYDDLEKLQKLKDKGTITDAQFQKERDKITNRWD